ncbi:tetratricopeptide repeat protein [Mucilaginibacter sp. UR6-11]|uniref:tetratricopeptide repeat protein n=1 Tax=Mucilaginibacter sp. UR6-11 TaxID=1435644 RepID=UPI001E5E066E|nr:tetratricopeptide repeat protein [Mucilaginibacter sp. UR6-11]MCC8425304.1 tetratricopeptide repeat protein [Mucilaginibacter sp. UR6-11]
MKMISKIAKVAFGLVFIGSAVFGQSLADAKKAIDAEQYQKAKGMLKNLTVTQPTNDENLFFLGWVYLIQDYPDSAKTAFTKGIAVDAKSALNYVGLGAVALSANDNSGATSNFNTALSLAGKKDDQPYLYIGKAYLLDAKDGKFPPAKANAAIDALTKAKTVNPKDAEVQVVLGNAYRSQLNSNSAYDAYQAALALDPKSPAANVATGVLWRYADNFEDSEKQFQAAIAIDPNYGPAYRELAETQKTEAQSNIKVASVKIKEAVGNYKKFLSLTDESVESLLRYADFLVNAGDYVTLQEVATKLSKDASVNERIYRYLGYAAYENKDYPAGLSALNNWFAKATPARILPRDYAYLGRLQVATGDTVKGVANLKKSAELDSSKAEDTYREIATMYSGKKKWLDAAKAYDELISKTHGKPLLLEHFYEGYYYYYSFNSKNPDSTLLVKADSAMSYVIKIATKPIPETFLTRGRIADLRDNPDLSKMQGYAKPFYDKYIEVVTALGDAATAAQKRGLAEAYAYEGNYAVYHDKDDAKAQEAFTKAKEIDPNNKQAAFYFDKKNGPATPTPPATPAKPKKTGTK